MRRLLLVLLSALSLVLAGCATTLRSDVTSFQRWPANAAGSTYSFKRAAGQEASLEHKTYEDLARTEMGKLALTEAPQGSKGRFEVSLDYGISTRTVQSQEPIWDHASYWHPAHYHPHRGWRPGYWAPSPYGPSVVGYRTVLQDVSTRRLRVDISDGGSKVFEASATSSGASASLNTTMPYLIRSVFDGFPGTNGQNRVLEFDVDKGAVSKRGIAQPG
jgi:predicted small secreted protein